MKAEKTLLTLITATVSLELRNPLYSLISQILNMDEEIQKLTMVIKYLKTFTTLDVQ